METAVVVMVGGLVMLLVGILVGSMVLSIVGFLAFLFGAVAAETS